MTVATAYTISETVLAAHLEGEAVLLDMESKHYFRLNGTGAFIWKALERGSSREEIVADLTATFTVTAEEAAGELDRLLEELAESGLIAAQRAG
jgi:hypothetical protein